jgi:hypothetical protein
MNEQHKKCLKSIDRQKISQITGYDPDDPVLEASSLWNRRNEVEWSTSKAKNPWPHPGVPVDAAVRWPVSSFGGSCRIVAARTPLVGLRHRPLCRICQQ